MFQTLGNCLRALFYDGRADISRCCCCGKCCEAFGGHLAASKHDLKRWKQEGRNDLLARVNRLGWIWVDPQTGDPERRCPFLTRIDTETAICSINDTKPAICKAYPTLAHGHRCIRPR